MEVLIPGDLDISNISFKKQKTINKDLKIIPLKYRKCQNLVIQTPLMGVPFNINIYKGKYYLSLSFHNYDIDEEMKLFYDKITLINKKINSYLFKKCNKQNNFCFDDSIKTNIDYPPLIRVNIPDYDKLLVFDEYKNQIGVNKVNKKTQCYAIIHLSHIWNHNIDYGISWKLLQLRMVVDQVITLSTYSFIENTKITSEINTKTNKTEIKEEDKIKNNPKFMKYFRMLKFGVPKEAIKNKLQLDGIDTTVIDIDPDDATPISFTKDEINTYSSGGFNFNEISLNEVSYIKKLKKDNKNVPTLQDILVGKANLTKTNYKLKNITIASEDKTIVSTPIVNNIGDKSSILPSSNDLKKGLQSLKKINKNQNNTQNKHISKNPKLNQSIMMPTANDLLLGIKNMKKKNNK
jgi:hypothetical protein